MSSEITVASTTDSLEDVQKIAGIAPDEQPEQKEQAAEPEEHEEQESRPHPSKSGFQKRIDKLTREKYELQNRLAALEKAPKAEPAKAVEQPKVEEIKLPAKPSKDDFNDYDEYIEALADWKTEQKLAAKLEQLRKEEAEAEQKAQFESMRTAYLKRLEAAAERYEDFEEIAGNSRVEVSKAIEELIITSEEGPDLQYYLGSHPDWAKKLLTMSPAKQLMEAGKVLAKLTENSEQEEESEPRPKKPGPPAPIRPLGGSSTKSSVPLDELDYQEYRKLRDTQIKNKYRR